MEKVKMKRKIIAFPPAPVKASSTSVCSLPPAPVKSAKDESVMLAATRARDLTILLSLLPEAHPYSNQLAEQLPQLVHNKDLSENVKVDATSVVSPGLVEIEFSVNKVGTDVYNFSTWIIQIGGEGPGPENSTELLGMQEGKRAPVAVRFAVPISHPLIDDIGFLDNAVWNTLPTPQPTLVEIVNMVTNVLLGPTVIDAEDERMVARNQELWTSAQSHTRNKYTLMDEFKKISNHSDFLGNRLTCSNLTVASWLQPEFVAMVGNLKSALVEVCHSEPGFSTDTCTITSMMNFHSAQKVVSAWIGHVTENCEGIYSFDMFTQAFCNSFIEEVALYEGSALPRRRPNTMNNYGLILNDIGMYGLMTALMKEYLVPLVQVLYSEEPVAYGLDHHHSFIVQYKRTAEADHSTTTTATATTTTTTPIAAPPVGDKGLDMHHDSSEVTVNVCLGKEGFVGGGLRFCGLAGSSDYRRLQYTLQHVIGRAVVHLGRHRHGADDLQPPPSATGSTNINTGTACAKGNTLLNDAADTTDVPASAPVSGPGPGSVPVSERLNLIMWLRSSQFRGAAAYGRIHPDGFPRSPEAAGALPDVCCLSKFNDADYERQLEAVARGVHV